jgi:hypothetical protein
VSPAFAYGLERFALSNDEGAVLFRAPIRLHSNETHISKAGHPQPCRWRELAKNAGPSTPLRFAQDDNVGVGLRVGSAVCWVGECVELMHI